MSDPKINVTIKQIRTKKKDYAQIIFICGKICIQYVNDKEKWCFDMSKKEAKIVRDFINAALKGELNG